MIADMWHSVDEEELEALAEKAGRKSSRSSSSNSWDAPTEIKPAASSKASEKGKEEPHEREFLLTRFLCVEGHNPSLIRMVMLSCIPSRTSFLLCQIQSLLKKMLPTLSFTRRSNMSLLPRSSHFSIAKR